MKSPYCFRGESCAPRTRARRSYGAPNEAPAPRLGRSYLRWQTREGPRPTFTAKADARFERLTAKNGKFYFNLKATNGQVIGTSEMYESAAGRDNGIDSVKRNAPGATVDDQTA